MTEIDARTPIELFDERDVTNLLNVIADIREKSGVGARPMLSELADAIAASLQSQAQQIGRLLRERDEALEALRLLGAHGGDGSGRSAGAQP